MSPQVLRSWWHLNPHLWHTTRSHNFETDTELVNQTLMQETNSRIVIDKLLRESDWVLFGDDGVVNVDTELTNDSGRADYVLKDASDFPLCVIEAIKQVKFLR